MDLIRRRPKKADEAEGACRRAQAPMRGAGNTCREGEAEAKAPGSDEPAARGLSGPMAYLCDYSSAIASFGRGLGPPSYAGLVSRCGWLRLLFISAWTVLKLASRSGKVLTVTRLLATSAGV